MDDSPLLTPFFIRKFYRFQGYFLVKFARYPIYGPFRETIVLNRRNFYYSGMINERNLKTG